MTAVTTWHDVQVKGHGSFLLYANTAPKSITVDDSGVEHAYDASTGSLTLTLPESGKLNHTISMQF